MLKLPYDGITNAGGGRFVCIPLRQEDCSNYNIVFVIYCLVHVTNEGFKLRIFMYVLYY